MTDVWLLFMLLLISATWFILRHIICLDPKGGSDSRKIDFLLLVICAVNATYIYEMNLG